jgi:hypothetical protein
MLNKKSSLSKRLISLITPFQEEFVPGEFKVYSRDNSAERDIYIVGRHCTEGYGVFYCYNNTALPILLSEERILKILGGRKTTKDCKKEDAIAESLVASGYKICVGEDAKIVRKVLSEVEIIRNLNENTCQ